MAKKKKKSLIKVSLEGLVLTVFGAMMLLLALVPAVSFHSQNIITGASATHQSFWGVLSSIFENGFSEGASLALEICTLVYLIFGVVAVVLGVLNTLNIVNVEKISVLVYLLTFITLLVYMIVFLTNASSLQLGGLASAKTTTLVYIPLAVSALFTGYGAYKLLKK